VTGMSSTRRPTGGPRLSMALPVALLLGYAYGWATSTIPSPGDPEVFWVANLAAPFVVVPFALASWVGRRRTVRPAPMIASGAVTAAGLVAGFYGLHRVGRDSSADIGQAETIAGAYARWLSTFVLGRPGGIPWLTIGVVGGCAAGVLGWLWTQRGALWAGILAVTPLVIEPLARIALGAHGIPLAGGYPRLPGNVVIWVMEALVGVLALWLVVRVPVGERRQRERRRQVTIGSRSASGP
jgi:hypothetical protein